MSGVDLEFSKTVTDLLMAAHDGGGQESVRDKAAGAVISASIAFLCNGGTIVDLERFLSYCVEIHAKGTNHV